MGFFTCVFFTYLFFLSRLSILTMYNSSIQLSNPFSTFCVCFRQMWNIGYGTWKQEVDLENIMEWLHLKKSKNWKREDFPLRRQKKVKCFFFTYLFFLSRLSILTMYNSSIQLSNPFSTFMCFRQTWNIGYGTWKQEVDLENIMGWLHLKKSKNYSPEELPLGRKKKS